MYNLKIITSTVRPGRKGPVVAEWIAGKARELGDFNAEVIDLGEVNLPVMNEPNHPMLKNYTNDETKKWSAKIDEADAFIFVTAEYNHSYPAALKNAIEFLMREWAYKAAGIVSYGGVSAGTRASNQLKLDLVTLRTVPLAEEVNIPFFTQNIVEGKFIPNEITDKAADVMIKELEIWTRAFETIRKEKLQRKAVA